MYLVKHVDTGITAYLTLTICPLISRYGEFWLPAEECCATSQQALIHDTWEGYIEYSGVETLTPGIKHQY
jgi:hypothetical protein